LEGEAVELLDDAVAVRGLGIEDTAAPGEPALVLLVCWIGDGGEELRIARRAAHVLGRATALGGDQLRVAGERVGLADPLDPDDVVPIVAKVVEVMDRPGTGVVAPRERPEPSVNYGWAQ
jgi:hypothetical protein